MNHEMNRIVVLYALSIQTGQKMGETQIDFCVEKWTGKGQQEVHETDKMALIKK